MAPLLDTGEEEESNSSRLIRQVFSYVGHTLLALAAWLALMGIGYAINPSGVPQAAILGLSIAFPLLVGYLVNRKMQNDLVPSVWLMGLIWFLIVTLWILDMPTAPGACLECNAAQKLTRTFLSLPQPSGLIDNDGPFIGTWPAVAMVGYAIGARLGLRKKGKSR